MNNERILQPGIIYEDRLISVNGRTTQYDLESREYGIGITAKGAFFYFDKDKFDLIKDCSWNIHNGFIDSAHHGPRLSRLVSGITDPNIRINYINGDKTDNRLSNLVLGNKYDEGLLSKIKKNNTTGYKGVSFHKGSGKYQSRITINGTRKTLGFFDTAEQAHDAYEKAFNNHLYGE